MALYRHKPVVVEAIQWTGDNANAIIFDFMGSSGFPGQHRLDTEGLDVGDYIIKGVSGEFYSCKPHVFGLIYEPGGQLER